MRNLVVLTGAGISAESGIKTFRDSDGLWEEHNVMDVASIDGWYKNPELMINFYNERRKQLKDAKPNAAHIILSDLQSDFNVEIITQNVDNLHERAGNENVLHLHGELTKVCSSVDPNWVKDIGYNDVSWGDKCDKGFQLRPFIVWFGEEVPAIPEAIRKIENADIFLIVGTSLNVYPAAGLINYVPKKVPIYLIDPNIISQNLENRVHSIKEKATIGMQLFRDEILKTLDGNE